MGVSERNFAQGTSNDREGCGADSNDGVCPIPPMSFATCRAQTQVGLRHLGSAIGGLGSQARTVAAAPAALSSSYLRDADGRVPGGIVA